MIRHYFLKRKLISLIDELATYNDKGIVWKSHDDSQVKVERNRLINLIEFQLNSFRDSDEKSVILAAIKDGSLSTDLEGAYVPIAKSISQ